jgi:hypothetical protein
MNLCAARFLGAQLTGERRGNREKQKNHLSLMQSHDY